VEKENEVPEVHITVINTTATIPLTIPTEKDLDILGMEGLFFNYDYYYL
jgi:hypothetical protein